jgi:CRISPR/Cas system-associated exonuclease Cas4 (RecB family)
MGLRGVDPEKYAATAARAGTLAHAAIEAELIGEVLGSHYLADFTHTERAGAEIAHANFLEWCKTHSIEPLLTEHSLVSERMRVGGTLDCYAIVDGVRCVVDFKTTARVYDNHRIQVSAYRAMLEEAGEVVEAVCVLPIPRDKRVRVREHIEPDTGLFLRVFEAARALYEVDREMRHRND